MNAISYICAGAFGALLYNYRNSFISYLYQIKEEGIQSVLVSKPYYYNGVALINFSHGDKTYKYPIKSNCDKISCIGLKLVLRHNEDIKDITPPHGFYLKIAASDFGIGYDLIVYHNNNFTIFSDNTEVIWPPNIPLKIEE